MNRKIIGLVMIVVSLTAMGVWEFWGRENLYYDNILVLKEPLTANTVITEDMFSTKRVEAPSKNALTTAQAKELVGMETTQFVPEDTELRKEYFQPSEYQVGKDTGKGLMSVSLDWLLSYPQTLKRGDKVSLYKDTEKIGDCIIAHTRDSSNNEIQFSSDNRKNSSGSIIYVEIISDISTLVKISSEAAKGSRFTLVNMQ